MYSPSLPDSRHESFAFHLASGYAPAGAYVLAEFSPNNAKARAEELCKDQAIQDRVAHYRACLPRIHELRDRFAPSLLLMPETQDQMLAWLWQVMNGTRQVTPLQLRAATLFSRMKGWSLARPQAASSSADAALSGEQSSPAQSRPTPLKDSEQQFLATFNVHNIATDRSLRTPDEPSLVNFFAGMARYAPAPQSAPDLQLEKPSPIPAAPAHSYQASPSSHSAPPAQEQQNTPELQLEKSSPVPAVPLSLLHLPPALSPSSWGSMGKPNPHPKTLIPNQLAAKNPKWGKLKNRPHAQAR